MFRTVSILIVFFLLLPGLIAAQSTPIYQPISFGVDVKPVLMRGSYSLADQDISLKTDRVLGEFGVTVAFPGLLRFRYSLVTGFSTNAEAIPTGSFLIGQTEFGQKQGSGSTASSNKPILLEWRAGPEHRFELTALARQSPIKPLVVARYPSFELMATSMEQTGGQQKQDTENFRKFIAAAGAEYSFVNNNFRAGLKLAGSKEMFFGEASVGYRFVLYGQSYGQVTSGYTYESIELDKGRVKIQGPWLRGEVWF